MKKILFAGSLLLIGMFIGCSKEKETAAEEKVKTQVLKVAFNQSENHPQYKACLLYTSHFTYVKNRGIAFGMFQGKLDIISIATVIAIVAIAYYLYKGRNKMSLLEKLGFTFVLAGAIGNMIDRIWRGFVIDMIDFRGIWSFVFNLADVWINIGRCV